LTGSRIKLLAIDLPVCLGIMLSGLLAVTVPVLADAFVPSQQITEAKAPPCHPKAPPPDRSACSDNGELCILCPSGILSDHTQHPFWLARQAGNLVIQVSMTDLSFRPELHPPISNRFS